MKKRTLGPALLFSLLGVLTPAAAPDNPNPSSCASLSQAPLSGEPRLVARQRKTENKALKSTIDVEYPELAGVPDAVAGTFRTAISAFVDGEIAEFESDVKAIAAEGGNVPGRAEFTLDIGYDTVHIDRSVVSLLFQVWTYTGGAHGLASSRAFNFDIARGRWLTLADLFLPGADFLKRVSDACVAELLKLDLGDDDWVRKGAGPQGENYGSWNITPEGLRITFDAYQVASYADGPQEVVVPFSALKQILRPDGPLRGLIK